MSLATRASSGPNVRAACQEWEAASILEEHLSAALELLLPRESIVVRVSKDSAMAYPSRWR